MVFKFSFLLVYFIVMITADDQWHQHVEPTEGRDCEEDAILGDKSLSESLPAHLGSIPAENTIPETNATHDQEVRTELAEVKSNNQMDMGGEQSFSGHHEVDSVKADVSNKQANLGPKELDLTVQSVGQHGKMAIEQTKDLSGLGRDNFIIDSDVFSEQVNLLSHDNVDDDVTVEPNAFNPQTISDPIIPIDFPHQPVISKPPKRDHPDCSDSLQRSTRRRTATSKNWKRLLDSKQPLD